MRLSPNLPYVLTGTFVLSPGRRLLFFPGGEAIIETDEISSRFNQTRLDHVTLDLPDQKDRNASHVAVFDVPAKESRGFQFRTIPPKNLMIPWFSFLTTSLDGFHLFPAKLCVTFPPVRPDIEKFGNEIVKLCRFVIGVLPPINLDLESFIEIDVWVGRGSNWMNLNSRPFA
jgi:hypothetical protein